MGQRRRLERAAAHRAAGYVRISSSIKQGDNHSPHVQREAISRLAQHLGLTLVHWESDEERGRIATRAGYQRLLEACRRGEVGAIIVFSLSRWGRSAAERLARGEELDHLGVRLYSVQQGMDQAGLIRGVNAVVDEESVRQLARTIRPAREAGARSGIHQGPTPYGYRRHYRAWDGVGKRPPGDLVPDALTAPVVQQMFGRYAQGPDSLRTLACWLNDERGVPAPGGGRWQNQSVRSVLCNVTYTGRVAFNAHPRGVYAWAEAEDYFIADGAHEALVSAELFERVQARMHAMGAHPSKVRTEVELLTSGEKRKRTIRTHLGAGLLVCRGCGGPMHPHWLPKTPGHKGSYLCRNKRNGTLACTAPGYRMDLAHEALLREVGRLRGSPWTIAAERRLGAAGESAERARTLKRAIEEEQRRLARHMELLTYRREPGPAELEAYEALAQQVEGRIGGLQAQLREVERVPDRMPDLRALHERLTRTELRTFFDGLDWAHNDVHQARVRALVLDTVQSAALAERRPERYSTWVRLDVTWTTGVHELLAADLLRLEDRARLG